MRFTVSADHPSLPGHFPGHPLVPGVVLLDRVLDAVETASVAAGHGPLGALRLPQVKFVQPLLPGQAARVELDGTAPRWRFRVFREATAQAHEPQDELGNVLLASGEVVADAAPSIAIDAAPDTAEPRA